MSDYENFVCALGPEEINHRIKVLRLSIKDSKERIDTCRVGTEYASGSRNYRKQQVAKQTAWLQEIEILEGLLEGLKNG
jgi:hypothetical protein